MNPELAQALLAVLDGNKAATQELVKTALEWLAERIDVPGPDNMIEPPAIALVVLGVGLGYDALIAYLRDQSNLVGG